MKAVCPKRYVHLQVRMVLLLRRPTSTMIIFAAVRTSKLVMFLSSRRVYTMQVGSRESSAEDARADGSCK
jgi:hypothetical protein